MALWLTTRIVVTHAYRWPRGKSQGIGVEGMAAPRQFALRYPSSIDDDHSGGDKDRSEGFLDEIPCRQILLAKPGSNDCQDNAK